MLRLLKAGLNMFIVCKIWCEKSSGSKSNCFWLGRTWKHHEVAKAQNSSELQSVTKIIIKFFCKNKWLGSPGLRLFRSPLRCKNSLNWQKGVSELMFCCRLLFRTSPWKALQMLLVFWTRSWLALVVMDDLERERERNKKKRTYVYTVYIYNHESYIM